MFEGFEDHPGNGVDVANPQQHNRHYGEGGNACDAGLNHEDVVSALDFNASADPFAGASPHCDVNSAGVVDVLDLTVEFTTFFPAPGLAWAPDSSSRVRDAIDQISLVADRHHLTAVTTMTRSFADQSRPDNWTSHPVLRVTRNGCTVIIFASYFALTRVEDRWN